MGKTLREDIDGPPRVSVNYGFVPERSHDDQEADAQRTILVVKVEGCGVVIARCVRCKGRVDPHAVGWLEINCVVWASVAPRGATSKTSSRRQLDPARWASPRPTHRLTTIRRMVASRRPFGTSRTRSGS